MPAVSKMIVSQTEMNANFTEMNHLGYLLASKPGKYSRVVNKLFAAENLGDGNYITSGLGGSVATDTTDNIEWEWKVQGADRRPLMVVQKLESGTNIGRAKNVFKIVLEKPWYKFGDLIRPLEAPLKFLARIQSGPEFNGAGYVYTLRLMTDDDNLVLPEVYLKEGKYWSKLFANYGEGSDKAGSTQFGSWLTFRGRMTHLKKEYEITDYASTSVLSVKLPTRSGGTTTRWIRYAEAEYFAQWEREKEYSVWFSRSTRSVQDNTGRPVTAGPGILEQLEDGNIARPVRTTYRMIEEFFQAIFFGRRKPGVGRDVKGFSGEYGISNLHRLGKDIMEKTGTVMNIETITKKDNSVYHKNSLQYGYQITKLNMVNGISLELYHQPLYDDPSLFSAIDPITGLPAQSQRMTFLDFGGGKQKNIVIMKKRDGFAFGYKVGLYGPTGPVKNGHIAHEMNGYKMIINDVLGVQVTDVTRTGEIIPGAVAY